MCQNQARKINVAIVAMNLSKGIKRFAQRRAKLVELAGSSIISPKFLKVVKDPRNIVRKARKNPFELQNKPGKALRIRLTTSIRLNNYIYNN